MPRKVPDFFSVMPASFVKNSVVNNRSLPSVWKVGVFGVLCLLVVRTALAEEAGASKVSWESEFRFALVGGAEFKDRSKTVNVDAMEFGTRDVLSMEAREGFLVRFGFELERSNFGRSRAARLPGRLQSASLVLGADLQLGEAWIVRLEMQPGFYSSQADLRARDFNIPVILGGSYFVSADLQLVLGLSMDLGRKYPVLPGVGVRWKFATDWVLNAILPTPRLEYSVNKSLLLYAGADMRQGSYRVDANFGRERGTSRLNNAVVDYAEIRVGGGASWKIRPAVTLEIEGGFVPLQDFDFHRADVRIRSTEVPPYGRVALKAAF
jgi:hypothetical protein